MTVEGALLECAEGTGLMRAEDGGSQPGAQAGISSAPANSRAGLFNSAASLSATANSDSAPIVAACARQPRAITPAIIIRNGYSGHVRKPAAVEVPDP